MKAARCNEGNMRIMAILRLTAVSTVAAITAAGFSAAAADSAVGAQPAQWTPKEFNFIYQGFTTKYSCDGLADKLRDVLLAFGARKDLQMTRLGCAGRSSVPDPFPGVAVRMNVLTPADAATAGVSEPTVPAHWRSVKLHLDRSSVSEAGECELVEQVKEKIVPLFTTRNVNYRNTCVPHQLTPGGTGLAAEVLLADAPAAGGGTPTH